MTGPPPPLAMEATMEATMEAMEAAAERFRRLFVCLFVCEQYSGKNSSMDFDETWWGG